MFKVWQNLAPFGGRPIGGTRCCWPKLLISDPDDCRLFFFVAATVSRWEYDTLSVRVSCKSITYLFCRVIRCKVPSSYVTLQKLNPSSFHYGPTNNRRTTNQPAAEKLKYSRNRARQRQRPTNYVFEVWQDSAPFGGRPIGGAVEALLTKVVNNPRYLGLPIVIFFSAATDSRWEYDTLSVRVSYYQQEYYLFCRVIRYRVPSSYATLQKLKRSSFHFNVIFMRIFPQGFLCAVNQYLLTKRKFPFLNSQKGFWRSLAEISWYSQHLLYLQLRSQPWSSKQPDYQPMAMSFSDAHVMTLTVYSTHWLKDTIWWLQNTKILFQWTIF